MKMKSLYFSYLKLIIKLNHFFIIFALGKFKHVFKAYIRLYLRKSGIL